MLRLSGGLVAATLLLSTPASAESWRAAAEKDDETPYVLMFVDESSVTRKGDIATGWVLTLLEPDTSGGRDWDHSVIYRDIDCRGARSRMLHTKFYSGDRLIEDDDEPEDWKKVTPGTLLGDVADVMCGRESYLTDVVGDPIGLGREYFSTLQGR